MLYVANSFSLSMLPDWMIESGIECHMSVSAELYPAELLAEHKYQSVVGHADTAALFEQLLGHPIAVNRTSLRLSGGDQLLVGQYIGPRLPEGATELPEGASVRWMLVDLL